MRYPIVVLVSQLNGVAEKESINGRKKIVRFDFVQFAGLNW